jgi:hypothetical protein
MIRAFALLLALAAGPAVGADGFVPGTEDLPLMPGLVAVAGSGVVFDKPQGRIVEAQARGAVKRDAVRRFYGETLPSLGWSAAGQQRWQRDNEALAIDIKGRDGAVTVGFTLTPKE